MAHSPVCCRSCGVKPAQRLKGAVLKVNKSTKSQPLDARNKRGEERLSRLFACLVFHNHRFLQEVEPLWPAFGGMGKCSSNFEPLWPTFGGMGECSSNFEPLWPAFSGRGECSSNFEPLWPTFGGRGECSSNFEPLWPAFSGMGECSSNFEPLWLAFSGRGECSSNFEPLWPAFGGNEQWAVPDIDLDLLGQPRFVAGSDSFRRKKAVAHYSGIGWLQDRKSILLPEPRRVGTV